MNSPFILEACRFSKSSYTFEFSGKHDEKFTTWLVSTSCNVSLSSDEKKDVEREFSTLLWEFLETKLNSFSIDDSQHYLVIRFTFENFRGFDVWANEPVMDNMLFVKDADAGDWFVVG